MLMAGRRWSGYLLPERRHVMGCMVQTVWRVIHCWKVSSFQIGKQYEPVRWEEYGSYFEKKMENGQVLHKPYQEYSQEYHNRVKEKIEEARKGREEKNT